MTGDVDVLDALAVAVAGRLADAVAVRVLQVLDERASTVERPGPRAMLRVQDVADRLALNRRTVMDMLLSDPPKLASFKVGPAEASRVVDPAELDRYLAERRAAA